MADNGQKYSANCRIWGFTVWSDCYPTFRFQAIACLNLARWTFQDYNSYTKYNFCYNCSNLKLLNHYMLIRIWNEKDSHILAVGMQNSVNTLEGHFAVSSKANQIVTTHSLFNIYSNKLELHVNLKTYPWMHRNPYL